MQKYFYKACLHDDKHTSIIFVATSLDDAKQQLYDFSVKNKVDVTFTYFIMLGPDTYQRKV